MSALIITLVGPDRPGLVGSVSDVVQQHGGNWLESRMAHLAGHFAGIVQVEVAAGTVDTLVAELNGLSAQGLKVIVEKAGESAALNSSDQLVTLNVMGSDRPGIVREITSVLAQRSVNVEELTTECIDAPMTGEKLFKAEAWLRVPGELAVEDLQTDLEQIAMDLMVDFTLATTDAV